MAYKVKLSTVAEADAYAAFDRIRAEVPRQAERWLRRLFETLETLSEMPSRCPVIPEAEVMGREIRHLLYGRGAGIYRLIFDIQENSPEGPRVRVLRIRHGSRDRLLAEDLEQE